MTASILATRAARTAAYTRRKRSASLRYRSIVRFVTVLGAATVLVVAYLWLMANVTKLNYEYAKATRERAALQESSAGLDDQVAHLESRERLAAIAAKLGMSEPPGFRVATLLPPRSDVAAAAQPQNVVRGVALLPAITDWLR